MNTIKANEIIKSTSMSRKAAAVLHNLAMHSNKKDECFPALKTIAKEVKMSVRSVQRALDELLEAGLITKKHNYRANGSQTSNIYKIIAAVEDRAAAAISNAQLKLQDMRKRMEYAQKRQAQTSLFDAPSASSGSGKSMDDIVSNASIISRLINLLSTSLKNTHLSRGAGQTDYPGTQQFNY